MILDFLRDPQTEWIWNPIQSTLVVFGFWLVIRQLRLARDQNSIGHMNYFREVWNSEALLRARLAVVDSSEDAETDLEGYEDVVAIFMEDLGAALYAGQASEEHIWNYYSYYVEGYWQILQPKIAFYRRKTNDCTYFERFERLYKICTDSDAKRGTSSMLKSYLFAFRNEEAKVVCFMLNERHLGRSKE